MAMRLKKLILFLILCSLFVINTHAQNSIVSDTVLTLQECVDAAVQNNLQVKTSEFQMQSNGVYWKQAKDNLLPVISASGNQALNFGRSINVYTNTYIDEQTTSGSYGLNGSLILFSGLGLQNAIKQTSYAYDAAKMDWQQQKDNITLAVILAYLQVLSTQDLLAISIEQGSVDSAQVERLKIQNDAGAIPPSSLYDLQGQYANDLVNITQAVNAHESAKINLFQLLNIKYHRSVELERIPLNVKVPEYSANSDSIYYTALNTLPLIRAADLRTKALERALGVARSYYYPTLSLFGSIYTNYSTAATTSIPGSVFNDTSTSYVTVGPQDYQVINKNQNFTNQKISFGDQFKNNRYTQVGLSLYIPILNSLRARNNVKLAKINLQNQQFVASSTRIQLQQMVEQAYQNMISAYGQYKSYIDQVDAYALSFKAAEIKFNAGAITSVDYVIAKNNVDRATINLTVSRYNYVFRTKILDYYQGRLSLQ